ncbi:MAG: tetratricopeptide repeat protein [Holosporaceae bacterium]|jgi:Flp pilus assembly protein TadD|nr:tetratricopeptide repeat protein [Holosporaceae bacterium]
MKSLIFPLVILLISGCADEDIRGVVDGPSLLRVASKARKAGNVEAAVSLYQKAINKNRGDSRGYIGLAECYIDKNVLDAALEYVKKAEKLNCSPKSAAYLRGKIFLLVGDQAAAEKEFLKYETPDSLNALGAIYDSREEHTKAQNLYRRVIAMSPDYIDAYNNMGLSLMLCKRYETAIFYLKGACALPEADVTYRSNLALAYGLSGDIQKAKEVYAQDFEGQELESRVAYIEDLLTTKSSPSYKENSWDQLLNSKTSKHIATTTAQSTKRHKNSRKATKKRSHKTVD